MHGSTYILIIVFPTHLQNYFLDPNSNTGKKIKKDKDINDIFIKSEWEYGYGKGKWKPYDPTQNKNISQAFSSGEKTMDIKMPRSEQAIIFERMVQRNKKTGWEVAVRCKPEDVNVEDKCMQRHLIC